MKILVLSNLYPPHFLGGYELNCQLVVEELKRRGHQLSVLTSDHQISNPVSAEGSLPVERRLKIHGMFGHPWLGIQQLAALELYNNRVLTESLDRFQPDLVYVWNLSGLSKSMLFTLHRRDVPMVVGMCDHWIARSEAADVWLRWWNREDAAPRQRLLRWWWTLTGFRRRRDAVAPTTPIKRFPFSRIHFCSRALRDLTEAAGFKVGHGAIVHCMIDAGRFKRRARLSNGGLQKLLYVGRLHEDKGIETALEALSLVRDKFAGSLSIYGRGEPAYEKRLQEFVTARRLPVTFRSLADPESMPDIYAEHEALLFTSIWPEPFAITPLEAMAAGLPVIGTLTGGSGELFRHGENALTYQAGHAEDLARRILELDQDPKLRARIADTGWREVPERFDVRRAVDPVETYLEETRRDWRSVPLHPLP
jgi:glycogen(starch) synthase